MNLLKKLFALVIAGSTAFALTGCSLLKKDKKTTDATQAKTSSKSKLTTARPTIDKDEKIVDNGLFLLDRKYNFNVSGDGVAITLEMSFTKEGNATLKNLNTSTQTEYTYQINDKIITCTNKSNSSIDYYYYYEDIIVSADLLLYPGTLASAAVSQRGKTTLAYVAFVTLKVGDVPAVLSNDKSNTNKYYKLYKNGTIPTSGSYVIADQLEKFDTTKAGKYLTTLQVSNKSYPVVVNVTE